MKVPWFLGDLSPLGQWGLGGVMLATLGLGLWALQVPQWLRSLPQHWQSPKIQTLYQTILAPHQRELQWALVTIAIDSLLIPLPLTPPLHPLEVVLAIVVAVQVSVLGVKLINQWFDNYWLTASLAEDKRINSELLLLGRFLAQLSLGLGVILAFAQTHAINLVGLVASVGIGGVALAFASQKIVEQILWSVVIYIDRPFEVGDYIHLPDRSLGKVEAVGWRSTKVRLSGKNTLAIVPNSHLAQVNIENLSRAQRVILMIDLSFFTTLMDEEKALIRQLIVEGTSDILGIDHQLTQITFQEATDPNAAVKMQVQAIFFVLGSAETSMELRRSLLVIAQENIIQRLQAYNIDFQFQEKTINITQPMNI